MNELSEWDIKVAAMNIINQILDIAETTVEKRQAINDNCDEFVVSVISNLIGR